MHPALQRRQTKCDDSIVSDLSDLEEGDTAAEMRRATRLESGGPSEETFGCPPESFFRKPNPATPVKTFLAALPNMESSDRQSDPQNPKGHIPFTREWPFTGKRESASDGSHRERSCWPS
jgi:hypothetical protein